MAASRFPGVTRRCGCVDPETKKKYGARCPRLANARHGTWHWRAELGPGFDPDTGEWGERRRPAGTAESANAARDAREAAIRRYKDADEAGPPKPAKTVREALADAMRAKKMKGLAHSTLAEYQDHLDRHILPWLGDLDIIPGPQGLTAERLEARYAEIRDGNEARVAAGGRAVGPATVHAVHRTVRLLLSVLYRRGVVPRNVAKDIELATPRRRPIAVWDAEQLGRFLDKAEELDDPLLAAWYVVVCLGLRRGELCGLRWSYIDLDAGTVTIPSEHGATLITVDGRPEESGPKTEESAATLYLDAVTVGALKAHRRRQAAEQLEAGPAWQDAKGLVFTRPDGSPYHPDAVSRRFRRLAKLAGLPPIPPKNLRHSSLTLGLRTGAESLHEVADRARHTSTATTRKFYAAPTPERAAEAAEKRAAAIPRRPSPHRPPHRRSEQGGEGVATS